MNLDFRTLEPKAFVEIFPSLISQSAIRHQVLLSKESKVLEINAPSETQVYPAQRPS